MSTDTTFIAASNARNVERNGLVSGLEQNPYAVLAVAGARVYHAKLNAKDSQWVYSRWKGTLSFGRDMESFNNPSQDVSETERYWFRLADNETGRTVWMFKFPENFEYVVDRPFFHVFQGRVSLCSMVLSFSITAEILNPRRRGHMASSSMTTTKLSSSDKK